MATHKVNSKIAAMEIRMLRKIDGVSNFDKSRIEAIRANLAVFPVVYKIEENHAGRFEHISRMMNDNFAKVGWLESRLG